MMIIACRRGPALARVADIVRTPFSDPVEETEFVQLPTVEGDGDA
jgi:hypothetical protein